MCTDITLPRRQDKPSSPRGTLQASVSSQIFLRCYNTQHTVSHYSLWSCLERSAPPWPTPAVISSNTRSTRCSRNGDVCRPAERDAAKDEFAAVAAEHADRVALNTYTLVGARGDADFMLWGVCPELEPINELAAQLNQTRLGGYLDTPSLVPGHDPALTLHR